MICLENYEISQQLLSDWSPSRVSEGDASTCMCLRETKLAAPLEVRLCLQTALQIVAFACVPSKVCKSQGEWVLKKNSSFQTGCQKYFPDSPLLMSSAQVLNASLRIFILLLFYKLPFTKGISRYYHERTKFII